MIRRAAVAVPAVILIGALGCGIKAPPRPPGRAAPSEPAAPQNRTAPQPPPSQPATPTDAAGAATQPTRP